MRILIVQFGHYAFAAQRFARGEDETFYAQRYTVEYVADLARAGHAVCVVSLAEDVARETLPSGVESVGIKLYPGGGRFKRPRIAEVLAVANAFKPTHMLLHTPLPALMRWAIANKVDVLPLLADSFHATGLRQRARNFELAFTLNHRAIRWISNHGPNAAADLVRIGVNPKKVVPFDWPALVSPVGFAAKPAPSNPRALKLIYVGQLVTAKGVGDVIEAVSLAAARGDDYRLTVVGGGDDAALRAHASKLGVQERVSFAGRVAHSRVLEMMNEHDVVVVPSRHEYPEGMPMTIYEGLASRSAVVVSDHPMFLGRLTHAKSGMVFRAGEPAALLEVLTQLATDKELYERMSREADTTCASFFGPLKWDQLITRWLSAKPADDEWLEQFALAH